MAVRCANLCSASPSQKLAESLVNFVYDDTFISKNKPIMDIQSANLYEYLFVENSELKWRGDLITLQKLVKDELNLTGKWTSPGGDVKQFSCLSATIKWYQGKKVLKILGKNTQTIEQRLRAAIEISRSKQTNIEASQLSNIKATHVQGDLSEPQNNTSVEELSEIPSLVNKTKASDPKTKVCNCDCICIGEINTSDGKLYQHISTSASKLSAEISQNVLEIDTLKAKQKDLEVKIHQQEEMIYKLNQENSVFKFKFESLENLILRLQENNDRGLGINEINISSVMAPINNVPLNKSNKSNITLAKSDSLSPLKSPVNLNVNTESLSDSIQRALALALFFDVVAGVLREIDAILCTQNLSTIITTLLHLTLSHKEMDFPQLGTFIYLAMAYIMKHTIKYLLIPPLFYPIAEDR